ncbi:MAG: type II secretion system F family protein [Micropruina sp.]|nr:type II secretion system F family protein [Micropruina sp.]
MTALQLWMVAGVLVGAGVACLIAYLSPAHPDLAQALDRLSPTPTQTVLPSEPESGSGLTDQVGLWAMRHLPGAVWVRTPTRDLALLGRAVHTFYGEKILFAAIATAAIPVLTLVLSLTVAVPLAIPAAVTLLAAIAGWFIPNGNVADAAIKARAEFLRALGSYVDLVALERNAGAGTRQALENAAAVGDTWPFRRISETLKRSRFSRETPWESLHQVALQVGLPALDDLADIMRLCGEEGSQVYDTLRARSTALRSATLTADQTAANAQGERLVMPTTLMAFAFIGIFLAPALLRLLAG